MNKTLALVLCAAALTACEKNAVQIHTGPLPEASIKFFNFGVGAPAVNFFANDRKMTAVQSTTGAELTTGVTYGNVGAAGYYTGIEPGQYTISGRIPMVVTTTATGADTARNVPISNVPATIEAGKNYSFYQSGVYDAATKTVDGFVVEDPFIPQFDYSVAYVRFVNAIHNSQPMTLHAKNDETLAEVVVGGPVAYKSAGAFTALPGGVYDLTTFREGRTTPVISRANVSFSVGRVYTITSLGDTTITLATDAKRPLLDVTRNR